MFALLITISIGTIQFGYSIGSWNTAFKPYQYHRNWDDQTDAENYQTAVQSVTTAGSAVGALLSGPIAKYGRWNCIILFNMFTIVGAGLTLVDNYSVFVIGRVFYGIACGGFSVFCPKYISEVSPSELKGPAGCLS